jgi:hypothetical protein
MALSENKSYVVVRENDTVNQEATFRFFTDNSGRFEEMARGRFATVRARMNYVLSAAWDEPRASIYTISVPNPRSPRLVVSRFDRGDMTLSEEFLPTLNPASGLHLQTGRSVDEYVVTGAGFHEDRLYALSASYGTLLVIDPSTHRVVAARALSGSGRPTGVAIRDKMLYTVDASGGMWAGELGAVP